VATGEVGFGDTDRGDGEGDRLRLRINLDANPSRSIGCDADGVNDVAVTTSSIEGGRGEGGSTASAVTLSDANDGARTAARWTEAAIA
jgi:hypothetical protein